MLSQEAYMTVSPLRTHSFFCDIIGPKLPCVIEHPAEQTAVNALQLGRRKLKGFLS